ncbi:MAG: hypothetical protein NDI73_07190 [Desulfuromonadales bacterium]|nr:hypothetical protein [Desulfuromonadales bacterium]
MRIPFLILLLALLPLPSLAADLDGWRIVRISAADRLAVAKAPDGELRLVREGDRLGGQTIVKGFDDERVILEQPGEWGRATLFVRVVDGRQQVEIRERQPLRKCDVAGEQSRIVADGGK